VSTSREALRNLSGLAALQGGVVTRDQADAHGVSPRVAERLVAEDHWRRLERGVFLTHGGEAAFRSLAWAGTLIGGEGARVGGLAAARLDGLSDSDPASITVLVPHTRRPAARHGWEFVRERPGSRSPRTIGSPPRTTVEETVLDLCATARPEDVVGWVTLAVERRRTTPKRLLTALHARARHPRRQLVESLVSEARLGAHSPLEVTYLRDVEGAHGLSALVRRQLPSRDHRARRDVWYVDFGVVVELDGRLGHTELGRFRDMDRDNAAGLDGLLTLRFGSLDLHGRPCAVAGQVSRALTLRGWAGLPTRCPRCTAVPDRDWG
jgi:hypothetical protein